jgi:hypothetical protein
VVVAHPGTALHDPATAAGRGEHASRCASAPRNSELTGTSSALASRASVVMSQEVAAFSIFDSIALEIPTRSAISPTVSPVSSRSRRTWTAIARSRSPSVAYRGVSLGRGV